MKLRSILFLGLAFSSVAHAGWTIKVLHPAGATSSSAYCTDGVTAGGAVDGRAAVWNIATGAVTYLGSQNFTSEVTGPAVVACVPFRSNKDEEEQPELRPQSFFERQGNQSPHGKL